MRILCTIAIPDMGWEHFIAAFMPAAAHATAAYADYISSVFSSLELASVRDCQTNRVKPAPFRAGVFLIQK